MDTKSPTVYLLASHRNGTLYAGVTTNLIQRVWQHKEHVVEGFTRRHGVTILVWYETHATLDRAITCEKRIKKWNRVWKLRLIEERNPAGRDLWDEILGCPGSPPSRG
jgi:putative endonuclease